ncbi:MAG TPA: hypothetical protein VJ972_14550, partial [Anaerolineales bacterium]|nr:hypothetical protein [Anaerolineales bacterium]
TLHMELFDFQCYAVIISNCLCIGGLFPCLPTMSTDQKIILANGSRLLREMLNRILLKIEHLKVVQEVTDHDKLPAVLEQQDADWVVMSLPADRQIPAWTDSFIKRHPLIKIIAFSSDGSWIKMKWLESHEEDISDLSLPELIHILENNPGST